MSYKLLDLFCGAGGCSEGYRSAGFEVVGVDIKPQPNYPFRFILGDALTVAKGLQDDFDVLHASPPCQAFTKARKLQGNKHVNLIPKTRSFLQSTGKPWCIENVPGSPLVNPVELCGLMFDLKLYRHRLFETNFYLPSPNHPDHKFPLCKMGRPAKDNEVLHIVGHFSGVPRARKDMGIPWMSQSELAQAIPPAYTKYIGEQLIAVLNKESG